MRMRLMIAAALMLVPTAAFAHPAIDNLYALHAARIKGEVLPKRRRTQCIVENS